MWIFVLFVFNLMNLWNKKRIWCHVVVLDVKVWQRRRGWRKDVCVYVYRVNQMVMLLLLWLFLFLEISVFCGRVTSWIGYQNLALPWWACEHQCWADCVDWPIHNFGNSTATPWVPLAHVLWWSHLADSNWLWHRINTFASIRCGSTYRRRFVVSTTTERFAQADMDWTLDCSRHVRAHIPPNVNRLPAMPDGRLCWFDLGSITIWFVLAHRIRWVREFELANEPPLWPNLQDLLLVFRNLFWSEIIRKYTKETDLNLWTFCVDRKAIRQFRKANTTYLHFDVFFQRFQ